MLVGLCGVGGWLEIASPPVSQPCMNQLIFMINSVLAAFYYPQGGMVNTYMDGAFCLHYEQRNVALFLSAYIYPSPSPGLYV